MSILARLGAILVIACSIAAVQGKDAPGKDTELVAHAIQVQTAQSLLVTDFYKSPSAHGMAGTLIRAESFSGYDLGPGVKATRILYWSRTQLNRDTVASAVLVTPEGAAPAGGWPVLVWAHGTTGVARMCAPSLTTPVGYYTQALVKEGLRHHFAVVAVDYSGLGAGERHEYLWKSSNANDTIYAAWAARAADTRLAPMWVAIGHSQGGQTVWGVAEKMSALKDPTFRGTVALAPAIDTKTLQEQASNTQGQSFYPVYVAYGIKTVYPDFDVADMLQPTGVNAYDRLTTQGCWGLANALFHDVKPGTVIRADWTDDKYVKLMLASNQVGDNPVAGPMFIASGQSDDAVPATLIANRVKALCKSDAVVEYGAYPGDHDSMMQSSFNDQMRWIADRFAGRPAKRTCP